MNGIASDWVEDLVIEWLCEWLSHSEINCKQVWEREKKKVPM